MGRWIPVGTVDEPMGPSGMRAVSVDGREIALGQRGDGIWVAFDGTCTHEACPLSEGDLEGPRVVCYCHNAAFDLETGAAVRGPAEEPIRIHAIREVEGRLEVRLDA